MDDDDRLDTVDLPGSSAVSNNNQPNAAVNSLFSNVNLQNQTVVYNNPITSLSQLALPPPNLQPNAAINSIFSNVNVQNLIAVHNNPITRPPFNFGILNPLNVGFNHLNFVHQLYL